MVFFFFFWFPRQSQREGSLKGYLLCLFSYCKFMQHIMLLISSPTARPASESVVQNVGIHLDHRGAVFGGALRLRPGGQEDVIDDALRRLASWGL